MDSALIQPAGVYPYTTWGRNPAKHNIYLHPDYEKRIVDYPVKYIIPLKLWPPFPFSYGFMGKPPQKVAFHDIVREFEDFSYTVQRVLGMDNVQDYVYVVAKMLGKNYNDFSKEVKKTLVTRDYNNLQEIVALTQKLTGARHG